MEMLYLVKWESLPSGRSTRTLLSFPYEALRAPPEKLTSAEMLSGRIISRVNSKAISTPSTGTSASDPDTGTITPQTEALTITALGATASSGSDAAQPEKTESKKARRTMLLAFAVLKLKLLKRNSQFLFVEGVDLGLGESLVEETDLVDGAAEVVLPRIA